MGARPFQVICEVEPATRPDLTRLRHQIGVLGPVATAFLVPDNHIGRATVSSIAAAHEVALMGERAVACINARDRNVLGFRRDLLTAAAYGVEEFLFVYGDRPESGRRSDDLTVRAMIDEARAFAVRQGDLSLRLGVSTRLRPVPEWKRTADALYVQVSYDVDALVRWRESVRFGGLVYAGVIVLPSAAMAHKLSADVPQLSVPAEVMSRLEGDPEAGTEMACEMVAAVRDTGAFDGVHLVPVSRYREVAAELKRVL